MDSNEFFQHPVPLGENLYDKTRTKVEAPPRKGEWAGAAAAAAAAAGTTPAQEAMPSPAAAAATTDRADANGAYCSSNSYLRKTMVSCASLVVGHAFSTALACCAAGCRMPSVPEGMAHSFQCQPVYAPWVASRQLPQRSQKQQAAGSHASSPHHAAVSSSNASHSA